MCAAKTWECYPDTRDGMTGPLQNCLYGVDGTLTWTDKGGNFQCSDPKFAKDAKDGRYPYYMPKYGSRVLGAGVDIGCYESYIPSFGVVISLH